MDNNVNPNDEGKTPKKEPFDISKQVYSHLLGEEHTHLHRKIAGGIIMIFGIGFIKGVGYIPYDFIHFIGEVTGCFIHGVGTLPFIENIMKNKTS